MTYSDSPQALRRAALIKRGLCMDCGKKRDPRFPSKVFCKKHLLQHRLTARVARGCKPWKKGKRGRPPSEKRKA